MDCLIVPPTVNRAFKQCGENFSGQAQESVIRESFLSQKFPAIYGTCLCLAYDQ